MAYIIFLKNKLLNKKNIPKNLLKFYHRLNFSLKKGLIKRIIHFLLKGHLIRKSIVCSFLKTNKIKKLQIGGGTHKIEEEGWLNGDIIYGDIYIDAASRLPFPNESLSFIFAEQFIEHLDFSHGNIFLKEAFRVLKKGGVLRLSTIDLKLLIKIYYNRNPYASLKEVMKRHKKSHNKFLTTPCHLFNDYFRLWGHKFIYDMVTLKKQLYFNGFSKIYKCKFGKSKFKELAGKERHADVYWKEKADILIVEAIK